MPSQGRRKGGDRDRRTRKAARRWWPTACARFAAWILACSHVWR